MSIREKLSEILRQVKDNSGLTYAEISTMSGCSTSSIRYALNGGDKTSMEVFDKLFYSLEVELHIEAHLDLSEYFNS